MFVNLMILYLSSSFVFVPISLKFEQEINGGDLSTSLTNFNKEKSIERFRKCYEGPLFSRPVVPPDVKLSAPEPPTFSRPNTGGKTNGNHVLCSNKDIHLLKPFGN